MQLRRTPQRVAHASRQPPARPCRDAPPWRAAILKRPAAATDTALVAVPLTGGEGGGEEGGEARGEEGGDERGEEGGDAPHRGSVILRRPVSATETASVPYHHQRPAKSRYRTDEAYQRHLENCRRGRRIRTKTQRAQDEEFAEWAEWLQVLADDSVDLEDTPDECARDPSWQVDPEENIEELVGGDAPQTRTSSRKRVRLERFSPTMSECSDESFDDEISRHGVDDAEEAEEAEPDDPPDWIVDEVEEIEHEEVEEEENMVLASESSESEDDEIKAERRENIRLRAENDMLRAANERLQIENGRLRADLAAVANENV